MIYYFYWCQDLGSRCTLSIENTIFYFFLRYLAIISTKTNIPIFGPFSNTYAKDSRIVLLIIDPNDQLHPIGIAIQVCT